MKYYTPTGLAKKLGVSRQYIHKLMKQGKLEAKKRLVISEKEAAKVLPNSNQSKQE